MYLRGRLNILKRMLIHVAALNLGLLMRVLVGVGTPRSLQGRLCALYSGLFILWRRLTQAILAPMVYMHDSSDRDRRYASCPVVLSSGVGKTIFTTGC